jgi:hypothetical protein
MSYSKGSALLTLGPSRTSSPHVQNGGANTSKTEQRKLFAPVEQNKRELKTCGYFGFEGTPVQ